MLAGVGIVMVVICCLSSSLYALISRGLGNDRDTELSARADAAVVSLASASRADGSSTRSPKVRVPEAGIRRRSSARTRASSSSYANGLIR